MTTDTPDDAVPAEAVRELVEEWRELASKDVDTVPAQACNDMARACANQLEALLADVEGERE